MHTQRSSKTLFALLASLALTACGGGGGSGGNDDDPSGQTDFVTFVKAEFAATSDATDPTEINDLDFGRSLEAAPDAFDDLLPRSP